MLLSKNFKLIFLILIFALSFTLRFYKLGQVPNGLSTDEADMGYNAYSILKTGKDIFKRPWPLFFQSLDDYKPGLVFYTSIPTIALFGLSDFSIRVAPAIFGTLMPALFFFLARLLYPKERSLPYILAVLVAFAPWSIALSRAMIWYIELLAFYTLFLISLLLSVKKDSRFILLSAVFLGVGLYIYYAALIYLPPLLLLTLYLYRKNLLGNLKIILSAAVLLLVIATPAIIHYFSASAKSRLNAISILTPDITLPLSISEMTLDRSSHYPLAPLIHNRRLVYANALLDNYVDYFNLDYLFVNSKGIRYFYTSGVGLFYAFELPFVLYGAYILIKRRATEDKLILSLLLISPIPAAITLGSPFPHRALLLFIPIQILSAIGTTTFLKNRLTLPVLSVIYLFSVYIFLHQYFIHSPREFTSEFDNGAWFSTVRDVAPKVNAEKTKYDKVIFTWSQGKLVPAIYFLFYNKVDPKIIQKKASGWTNEPPSYRQIYDRIDNIEFRPIDWKTDKNLKNTLFIGYPQDFPKGVNIIGTSYLPNGDIHFVFVVD